MGQAYYHQSGFLGGEWSPASLGRSDVPAYRMALSTSVNGIIAEEGPWYRRSGFQFIIPTRNRLHAKLLPFMPDTSNPYVLEFTDGSLRIFNGTSPVFTLIRPTVTSSSFSGSTLTLTLDTLGSTALAVGDDIMLYAPPGVDYASIGPFRNRVMQILTVNSGTKTITLGDDTGGGAMSGLSSASNALINCVVMQIFRFSGTPWSGGYAIDHMRIVTAPPAASATPIGIILNAQAAPNTLVNVLGPTGDTDGTFSLGATTFVDGPYLDAQGTIATPETGTVSAYSGSITFTPFSTSFTASDVGRQIRLFSEPPDWASGTTYAKGATVKYGDFSYWISLYASNVGTVPGTLGGTAGSQSFAWAPAPTAAVWGWGTITAQAGSSCTVLLQTPLISANGPTITQWRLGVFKSGQYPQVGLWHEGRLWLAGALPNRFDASTSNGIQADKSIIFSPTDVNGQVLDSSAIGEVLNADDDNNIMWLVPDHQGILMGTLTGEWLLQASNLNDPITPTSIQAHKVTKYGCYFAEPIRAGMSLIFIQRYARRILEYLADAFTQRYTARHLNEFAKHLTLPLALELAYQEETVPIIWVRMGDGSLAGCTYRRVSRFITEAPVFQAWHRHVLGGDYNGTLARKVQSLCVQAAKDLNLADQLFVTTSDLNGANNFIEVLRPLLQDV